MIFPESAGWPGSRLRAMGRSGAGVMGLVVIIGIQHFQTIALAIPGTTYQILFGSKHFFGSKISKHPATFSNMSILNRNSMPPVAYQVWSICAKSFMFPWKKSHDVHSYFLHILPVFRAILTSAAMKLCQDGTLVGNNLSQKTCDEIHPSTLWQRKTIGVT